MDKMFEKKSNRTAISSQLSKHKSSLFTFITKCLMRYIVITVEGSGVYHQQSTTDAYLYQKNLPALTSFTVCFWINLHHSNKMKSETLFSIFVPGR